VGFHTVSAINRTAEITYDVDPAYWGRGIASASCAAAVRWGFTIRKFVRIQATVLEGNLGSRRVLEKCHFAYEGTMRNFRMVRGEPRDYLLYAALPT
jgi:RimJ/RimL family protein N-acetyltransferase